MSDKLPEKQQSTTLADPLKFKKRKGTTDLGKDYEEYFPTFVITKLLQNKEVKDFRISANDDQFGAFDDFILEVDYINKPEEKYAVQLKHKNKEYITVNDFKSKKSDLYLRKYYQSFTECNQSLSNCKIILFTNAKFKVVNNIVIDVDKDGESVNFKIIELTSSSAINTSTKGKSYQFQLDEGNLEEIKKKYKDFSERFFLYTNQMNTHQLHNNIPQSLSMLFSETSVAEKFLKFISKWSLIDGLKDKLTKGMMVKVLTLSIAERLMHPYTFGNINEKQDILQKAITHFNITAFEKKSLEKVVKLWGDVKTILRDSDIKTINEIRKKFQISTKYIQNIDDLTSEESTKLLWVMDKCPLIIEDHPAAYEAAKLCGQKTKFVFITDNLDDKKLEEFTIFKTLSDLKCRDKHTYNDIKKNFTFTLFEEKTSFEKLIEEDNALENLITTDEIVRMTDNTDFIRIEKEKLCFPYVERHLYENTIDINYLQKLDDKTMVLISDVSDEKKLKDALPHFEIVSITDELHININFNKTESRKEFKSQFKYDMYNFGNEIHNDTDITTDINMGQNGSLTKYKLYFNRTETSPEEFKSLCDNNNNYQRFHHLRYHDEYFEWIKSSGDVSDLQNFSASNDNRVNNEREYAENIRHNLNIVIGDPGMGKSLFVKKLKNNLSSKYLPVIILPTDVPKLRHFIQHPKHLQKFFEFILSKKFLKFGNFEKQVLKRHMKNGKAVFLWDALDELSEDNKIFVEKLILTLSENSVAQFLTCRAFLRKQLENKFNVLSRELQPFVDKEQTNYIRERLQDICSSEELTTITKSIKENIAGTSYRDILGVPLQIYMMTELFRQDLAKYKKILCDFFVITDLYFHFIEEKFNFYFKEKRNYPPNYREDELIDEILSDRIKNYQQVALQTIFGTSFSMESSKESTLFLNKINKKGDIFGLITAVDIDMKPEFLHNSYAEYFAAKYLAENCRSVSNLDLIFDRKYTNVKYFFDLLLANNSRAHIAVLCKNLKYLRDYNGKDELAASWGERYPLLKTSKISDDSKLSQKLKKVNNSILGSSILINDQINYETKQENTEYHQIIEMLLENCDPNEEDDLFNFTPSMYAEKCECLFAAAIIGNKVKGKNYLATKNENFVYSLLYYSIEYNFIDISNLFDNLKFVILKDGNSIIHMTVANNQFEYLRKLLRKEVYRQNINYRNLVGDTALMTAARTGSTETVKYLKQQNAEVDAPNTYGFTPLMVAAKDGHLNTVKYLIQQDANVNAATKKGISAICLAAFYGQLEIVKYLKQENAEVNAENKNGYTPLMWAAVNGHLEMIKYLKQQNTKVDAADKNGFTSLMVAAQNGHLDTVKYLVQENANVDAAQKYGFTPLMMAALTGHLDTVKYLVQQNADVNLFSKKGQTPLYLAAFNGHLTTVKYLKQQNAKVDAANKDGFTPLMVAAQNGHLDTVEYLVQQNANVDAAQKYGLTPLMLAAQNGHFDTVKYLVQQNANVNASAKAGQTPLYLAACGGHLEIVKYLKQQNGNVNAATTFGFTPLQIAVENEHLDTVKYLFQQNATIKRTAKKEISSFISVMIIIVITATIAIITSIYPPVNVIIPIISFIITILGGILLIILCIVRRTKYRRMHPELKVMLAENGYTFV